MAIDADDVDEDDEDVPVAIAHLKLAHYMDGLVKAGDEGSSPRDTATYHLLQAIFFQLQELTTAVKEQGR